MDERTLVTIAIVASGIGAITGGWMTDPGGLTVFAPVALGAGLVAMGAFIAALYVRADRRSRAGDETRPTAR